MSVSALRRNKVIWYILLFVFVFYVLVDPILLYASTPMCPPPSTFDPYYGYCMTDPIDQFGRCSDPYLYNPLLKKCVCYPYCEGGYFYNTNTRTCEPITTSPGGEIVPLEGQLCAIDLNNDGEISQDEVASCVETPQGYLCPLNLARCDVKTKIPSCPSPYTYNNAIGKCEYRPTIGVCQYQPPSCPSPYTYNSATGKCEYQPPVGVCQYQQISLPWQNMLVSWNSPCSMSGPNSPCCERYCEIRWRCYEGDCYYYYDCQTTCTDNCVGMELWHYNAHGTSTLTIYLTPEMLANLVKVTFKWNTNVHAPLYPNACFDDDGSAYFYVNGVLAASKTWGDCQPCRLSVDISPSYFQVGQNTITIQTGNTYEACTSCCRRMYLQFHFNSLYSSGWQCSLDGSLYPSQSACTSNCHGSCPSWGVYNVSTQKCELTPSSSGGWWCSLTNSLYTSQSACTSNCHGSCPSWGVYNVSTQKCELTPTFVCPEGYFEVNNKCIGGCPYSGSSCMYYNGEWVCSPSKCFTESQVQDDEPDVVPGGYEDDAEMSDDGVCLGTVYIFNGKKMRCRKAGIQTGFHNCCDEAQGKIYDSTGSTGMMLGDAIKAIYLCLDLIKKARFLSQVKAFELVGNQVKLLDAYGRTIGTVTGAEVKVWDALAKSGKLPDIGAQPGTVFQFDFQSNYADYINSYLETMAPTLAAQIISMALTKAIDDPVLAAAVDLVAQAIFASLGWVSPWTVALSALNLVMSLFMGSCDEQDIITSTLNDSGYCHYVGTRCIKKLPLVGCVQKAKVYCCFNSKLARIIHEQGRPQLTTFGSSGGWGSAKRPNCRGFTPEEFQSIDFGQIDFSEYVADIQRRVRQNLEPQIMDIFQKSMENIQ